jgi:hypothetical protein
MVWFKLNGYPLKSRPTSKIGNSFINCHKANYMKHFIFGEKYSGRGHMILHGNLVELNFMSVKFGYWYNSNRIVEYKSWFSKTHTTCALTHGPEHGFWEKNSSWQRTISASLLSTDKTYTHTHAHTVSSWRVGVMMEPLLILVQVDYIHNH